MVNSLALAVTRTNPVLPADTVAVRAYAANPFTFNVSLTGSETFSGITSVRMQIREYPYPAANSAALADITNVSPSGTTSSFAFTAAQFNQTTVHPSKTYWVILTALDPSRGMLVLWRARLILHPHYASETTADPPTVTTKLTLEEANALYATIANLALKAPLASPTFTGTVSGITKTMVGLSNVDNTSDANKPVSTAQQTALDLKANLASPTLTGTVTTSGIARWATGTIFQYGNSTVIAEHLDALGIGGSSGINTGDNAINSLYSGLVSNATHTGDATGATALTVVGINGTVLSGLATGLLKNTTATGVPSIAVGGTDYYAPGGTDVSVSDGGTGRSTSTTAYGLIAAGTTATGPQQTLAAGLTTEMLVGGGASALPVWTSASGSGAPVRAVSPTITGTLSTAAITSTQTSLGTVTADGVLITNTTSAASGAGNQQYSPSLSLSGDGYSSGGGHMAVKFSQYVVPVEGTSAPTGKLTWDSSVGGAAAVTRMTLDTLGDLIVTSSKTATILVGVTGTHFVMGLYGSSSSANSASNRFTLAANTPLGWSNTINAVSVSANIDTSIIRSSAGVVEINNGTVGTLRDLSLRNITASGTLATSVAGAASTPAVSVTGAPYTAGSATTNYPLIYANGGTAPTTWSTAGTYFGINAVSGFAGNLIDLRVNGGASVFKVSNGGVVTCTSVTASGVFVATPNTLTGAGAISVSTTSTGYISTGAAQALTLADGVNGQIKTIIHTSDGGSGVLTPTTKAGYTTITFANVGDSVTLQFITGTGWCITGIFGAVAA